MAAVLSKDELKNIGYEISKCLSFDDAGDLRVDSRRLDPDAVVIKTKHSMEFNSTAMDAVTNNEKKIKKLEKIMERNQAPKQVLSKTTRIFNRQHYLIIIYKQEILVGEEALSSLANYEQYKINYVIEIKNLSNASIDKKYLTFTEDECRDYFNSKDDKELTQYLGRKMSIMDGYVVLPIVMRMHLSQVKEWESQQVIFYYDKALQLIHNYIFNRKFLKAYRSHREFLLERRTDIILKKAICVDNIWYQAVVYLSSNKSNFKVILWNLRNYEEYKLKVSQKYSEPYLSIRDKFAEVLLKSLFFVPDQNDKLALRYNYKAIPDKINKVLASKSTKRVVPMRFKAPNPSGNDPNK